MKNKEMATTPRPPILLARSRDWDDWLEQVKTTATLHDLWVVPHTSLTLGLFLEQIRIDLIPMIHGSLAVVF